MRKISTGTEPAEPLTREEARELIEYHAVKASEAARCGTAEAAMSHGAAAQALGAWMRHVAFVLAPEDLPYEQFDFDGGGEGY